MTWETKPLGRFCKLINGKAFREDDWSESGFPIIRIQNLNDSKKSFNHWSGGLERQVHVQGGDLLIAWSGTPGTSFGAHIWSGPEGVLNQHIFRVDLANGEVTKDWLRFCVNTQLLRLIDQAHGGVGLKHVTKGTVESLQIPLPPLAEQKRIAGILDAADALRVKRHDCLAQLETLLQSTFLDIFGDPAANPKEWPVVKMRDLGATTQYGTSQSANDERVGIPILRMNNITSDGRIDLGSLRWVDMPSQDTSKYTTQRSDLLFNRTNSPDLVGKTTVWNRDERYAIAGYLIRVRFDRTLALPDYVSGFLNSRYGKRYLALKAKPSNNMSNFSASMFREIPLPRPPIADQRRFASIVASVDRHRDHQRAHLAELDTLFASLQSRAFRGEL